MLIVGTLMTAVFAPTLPPTTQTPTDYAAYATTATSVHLSLGNPSNAKPDVASANNYLMEKPQYALSYNRAKGIPNWVSWQLNKSWLGDAPRQNNFRPDNTLPQGWYRVRPSDYTGKGYDKGHMAPSADRTKTIEDNSATFLMTNMVPQTPDNNQGYWADLEDYARTLVTQQGKELYIIAGSYGELLTIAAGKVTVPARIFKILTLSPPSYAVAGDSCFIERRFLALVFLLLLASLISSPQA